MNKLNFILPLAISLMLSPACEAQSNGGVRNVTFKINTETGKRPISPYIYGVNDFRFPMDAIADINIPNRRLGGGNFSTYNWENNFVTLSPPSTQGHGFQNSDRFVHELPPAEQQKPAVIVDNFLNQNLQHNMASLVTIPMMSYLPKDDEGVVNGNEAPPSRRFALIKPFKNGPLSLTPDKNDNYVYTDEFVHYLVTKYGGADSKRGIRFYDLDNEPEYWQYGHKLLHPERPTGPELIEKSIETAEAIKSQDRHALIFALSYGGLRAHWNFQNDPGYNRVKNQYPTYTAWFLKSLKDASNKAGYDLIDVVDLHYYSKAEGISSSGNVETVDKGSNDRGVAVARMNAPLALWDSTAVEKSVYENENNGRPLNVIQGLQNTVDRYYPGLKIAISEYNFGGWNDISGAIAEADFLGIAAKYRVFWASLWNTCPGGKDALPAYQLAGIKMFRNYDGKLSTFGDTYVNSRNEINNKLDHSSSIYASYTEKNKLHLIVINKEEAPIEGKFNIKSTVNYKRARVWILTNKSVQIETAAPVDKVENNSFSYSIPPFSIIHIVLEGQ